MRTNMFPNGDMNVAVGVVVTSVGREMASAALEECQSLLKFNKRRANNELYALDLDVTINTAIALLHDLRRYSALTQSLACKTCLHAINDAVFQIKDTLFEMHAMTQQNGWFSRLWTPSITSIVAKLAVQKGLLDSRMDKLCKIVPMLASLSTVQEDEEGEVMIDEIVDENYSGVTRTDLYAVQN